MKRFALLSMFVLCGAAVAATGGKSFAAEQGQGQDAFAAFQEKAVAIQQQMYAKQAELQGEYASATPDAETVKRLYVEMAELRGQMFAARNELQAAAGGNVNGGGNGWGNGNGWGGNGGWGCPGWNGGGAGSGYGYGCGGGGWGRGRGMGGGGRGWGRGGHCW